MKIRAFLGLILSACTATAFAQPPQWSSIEGLTPTEIGVAVLDGLDHDEIVEVAYDVEPLAFLVYRNLLLYEMPERLGPEGCVRNVWSAIVIDGEAISQAERERLIQRRRSHIEVSLSSDRPCLFADYSRLFGGITPEEGLDGLAALGDFAAGERDFSCRDDTRDDICADRYRTRLYIRYQSPWSVRRLENGSWVFLIGIRGGLMTRVTLPDDKQMPAIIERYAPPPS